MTKLGFLSILSLGLLLLSSCEKMPDWSDKERDPRLFGEWYTDQTYHSGTVRKELSYTFYPNGQLKERNNEPDNQYYTSNGKLFIYYKPTFKIRRGKEVHLYEIKGDTLLLTGENSTVTSTFYRLK